MVLNKVILSTNLIFIDDDMEVKVIIEVSMKKLGIIFLFVISENI